VIYSNFNHIESNPQGSTQLTGLIILGRHPGPSIRTRMLIHILVIVILHIPPNDNTEACICLELHMSSNQERDWSGSWQRWPRKPFHQH